MSRATLRNFFLLLAVLAMSALVAYKLYLAKTAVPSGLPDYYVYIPTGATPAQVADSLLGKRFIRSREAFLLAAEQMEYAHNPVRAGRFKLKPGMTLVKVIRHLRSGEQAPVNVVLTNERLLENVAAKVARFLEPDSAAFLEVFYTQSFLDSLGYTPQTLMALFIPNTYQMYWNTSPRKFVERMSKEHQAFWSKNNRLDKARQLNLTPTEVYTLASIVDRESLQTSEKPTIAGVYLNRLRINMPLQADPTAVFATRDFETTRVTEYHIRFDSPYNTYLYTGLPPGPISMASISGIDAVLNAPSHNYLFFCAIGDGSGLHAFAETYQQHLVNVARYRKNLKERGIQ